MGPGRRNIGRERRRIPNTRMRTVQICQEIENFDNFGANYRVLFSGIMRNESAVTYFQSRAWPNVSLREDTGM